MIVKLTILGQPCSKSNTSQIVHLGDRVSIGKSKMAKAYERAALAQIPADARVRMEGPVCVSMRIWYASQLSDLDESLILDCMQYRWQTARMDKEGAIVRPRMLLQPGVYRNDRQVREKHIIWCGVDKANPRAVIWVETMHAQQAALDVSPRALTNVEFFGAE